MLSKFTEIIMKNSVLFGISIALLSTFVNELVLSFINDIILPIIDRDGDNNGEPDINRIKYLTIKTNGITFRVGSFIVSLIRFIILIFIFAVLTVVLLNTPKPQ